MKFVAHDAKIANDFFRNYPLYMEALQNIVNSGDASESIASQARGFLYSFKDEVLLLDLKFLCGVTRILKRFSTELQVSDIVSCISKILTPIMKLPS